MFTRNKVRRLLILSVIFLSLVFITALPFLYLVNVPLLGKNPALNSTPLIMAGNGDSDLTILAFEYLDPEDFQMNPFKIYERIEKFQFTYSSSTLEYAIVIGAMFAPGLNPALSWLVVYVYINTLTGTYVGNLVATFTYNLAGSYGGTSFQESGAPTHQSSFMFGSNPIHDFFLFNMSFNKNPLPRALNITLTYTLSSSEFTEGGSFARTASLPALTINDVALLILFIVLLVIAIAAASIVTLILIIRRRRRYY